ncbi:hypothetical protein PLESTB_001620500 [Pleodorina starrii]|uniref:Uncharacterized protein n=1 Tax=Pleodorina starrii TaxID=330485 RepID=A0A9W6BYF9_9CHLO|nr:hypothetical protein PLESTM_001890500 [Pleodorina starrii]GLC60499.1 hypothetical protein PLESTB_001620500 [Pleodorina starrii]GLC69962.1 hypothetical protein PLESTF_000904300 [Pleodorina starrii]
MAKIRMYLRKETGGQEFMDRHCAYAQEASRAGITRLMSIDGDMALFAPAADLAAPYAEDLVSACVFTSQFLIVNRLDALHAYCNYMSNYFTQNVSTLVALAGLVGRSPEHYLHISDMELLQLFLTQTPAAAVSRRILCPEAPGVQRCDVSYAGCLLSSQGQAVESFFKLRTNQSWMSDPWVACANLSGMSSLVDWRADSRGVPVPIHRATGECLPVLHFQGGCKSFIPVFVEYYRELVREAFRGRLGQAGAAGGEGAAGGGQRRRLRAGELSDGLEWVEEWLGVT